MLLEKAIGFSKARSVKKIRAETPIQNGSRFYERNGFKFSRDAFLIYLRDKRKIEPSLKLHIVGDNKYWVDDDQQMELIRKQGLDFEIVARFKVMIKKT